MTDLRTALVDLNGQRFHRYRDLVDAVRLRVNKAPPYEFDATALYDLVQESRCLREDDDGSVVVILEQ
jgi:hypothetical protein